MKLSLDNSLKQRGGAVWTPANLSSLSHWYKFDTGFTLDSENEVTQWADQKGSNNLTSDGASATTPIYSSGAVHFDANNDDLIFGSPLTLGKFSIYFRAEWSSFSTADFILNPTGNDFLKLQSATEFRFKINGGSRHDTTGSFTLSTGTKTNIGLEREDTGSTTNDQLFFFVNNSSITIGGSGGGTQAITDTLDITQIGQPAADMKIYELIVCSDALSTADRNNLNTYLNKI